MPLSQGNISTTKNKGGRPTKMHIWLKAFKNVVNEGMNSIYYTDDELRELTNFKLNNEYTISNTTFKNWKKGDVKDDILYEFLALYKRALLTQKKFLFEKLQKDDDKWQKWAWIIERKFDEWNMKIKNDTTLKGDKENPLEQKITIEVVCGNEIKS